jgi:hypothetical protein
MRIAMEKIHQQLLVKVEEFGRRLYSRCCYWRQRHQKHLGLERTGRREERKQAPGHCEHSLAVCWNCLVLLLRQRLHCQRQKRPEQEMKMELGTSELFVVECHHFVAEWQNYAASDAKMGTTSLWLSGECVVGWYGEP